MRSEIVTDAGRLFCHQESWEELHRRTRGSVSMSYDWLQVWWKIFGPRFELRALVGWEGDRLVGLFPCFIERLRLSGLGLKRMRFLGEYSILSEYHPLVEAGIEEDFARAASDFCVESMRLRLCDLIDFHAYPASDPFMAAWVRNMRDQRLFITVRDRVVPRVRIDLPGSVAEYWKSLSHSERAQVQRKARAIAAKGGRVACVTNPDAEHDFRDYVALNTRLWTRKGAGGYYLTNDSFTAFQQEVTRTLMRKGAACLYFLEQGGKRFAALQVFRRNGIVQAYLGGRDPDHELAHLSPGKVIMAHAITRAIEEGQSVFDFVTGDQEYKYRLGGTVHGWHGRTTAALRSPAGWKGIVAILVHNAAVSAGKSDRLRWVVRVFDRISKTLRSRS